MSLALTLTTGVARLRRYVLRGGERQPAPVSDKLRELCIVTTEQVNGRDVITLVPKSGASGVEIIYTHGGAYVHPVTGLHWNLIQSLIERTGATFTVPLYKLAPAGTMPEAYELLDQVYASVVHRASGQHPVFLAGDSAGGGLALGQAIRYRDAGQPAPTGVVLFSPWVELSMTNPAIEPYVRRDPLLKRESLADAAKLWTNDLENPLGSQLSDSLAGLPPLAIYQGGNEIFTPDVDALVEKAEAAGTQVHYWFTPKAFHVWVAITFLPESRAALDDVGAWLKNLG